MTEHTTTAELELIGQDQEQMEDSGGHPWSVENGILSTMFLFNHSPQSQEFNVRVADDKTVWLKVYSWLPWKPGSSASTI